MVEEVDKDTLEQLSQGEEFPSDGSCAGCELSVDVLEGAGWV